MNSTRKLRWDQRDTENLHTEMLARCAVAAWLERGGYNITERLMLCISREIARAAISGDRSGIRPAVNDCLMERLSPAAQYANSGMPCHLATSDIDAMCDIKVVTPYATRRHRIRWDRRRKYEHKRTCRADG